MSDFDKLIDELALVGQEQTLLAKSVSAATADDAAIAAAAAPAAAAAAAPAAAAPAATATNPEDAAEEALAKSVEAMNAAAAAAGVSMIPGEDLMKSMDALGSRVGEAEGVLAKGLTAAIDLIRGQGEMIKSMQSQIHQLSSQGAGRKTMLAINERQPTGEPLVKSEGQYTVGEVMAKANQAFDAKKITGLELTSLDVSLRSGQPPSKDTLAKILS